MAEGNGNEAKAALERLKERVDKHDVDFGNLRVWVKDLDDAMVVQSRIERLQSEAIEESRATEKRLDEQSRARQKYLDDRVDKVVSAIGDLISRIPPDNLRK
jgi:hypothetical protein